MLNGAGYEAYAVGGCVRDALLGREPHDWDIATSAVPEKVKEVFRKFPQADTGLKHGTVTVVIENEPTEITTFRIDGAYSDGRRPDSVAFTTDIAQDLARRDFTINACAADGASLIDPFGGREDLSRRVLRCVGDPEKRFKEDALRILRGIRFASELGFSVEEKTKEAMFACRGLLGGISQERITQEFRRTLLGGHVADTLSEFREIVAGIVPEMRAAIGFSQRNPHHIYDVYEHIVRTVGAIDSDILLRTAMFFHDIGKPRCLTVDARGVGHFYGHPAVSASMTEDILRRMRYPAAEIRAVTELIENHDLKMKATRVGVKRALYRVGAGQFGRLLKIKEADISAQNPAYMPENLRWLRSIETIYCELLSENACFSKEDLAISGSDLIRAGIPEGAQIGAILDRLLRLVIDEELENQKDRLLQKAMLLYRDA